jgi:hypothetical protein
MKGCVVVSVSFEAIREFLGAPPPTLQDHPPAEAVHGFPLGF